MVNRYIVGVLLAATAVGFLVLPGPPNETASPLIPIAFWMPVVIAFAMPRFRFAAALTPAIVYHIVYLPEMYTTALYFHESERLLFVTAVGFLIQAVLALLGSYLSKVFERKRQMANSSP